MTTKTRSLVALAWTLLIFGLCWTPRTMMPIPEDDSSWLRIPSLDKVVHFLLLAGFGFLWGRAGVRPTRVVGLGLLVTVVSELGQETAWVNRDATLGDGVADMLGVLGGLAALALLRWIEGRPGAPASARTPSAGTP